MGWTCGLVLAVWGLLKRRTSGGWASWVGVGGSRQARERWMDESTACSTVAPPFASSGHMMDQVPACSVLLPAPVLPLAVLCLLSHLSLGLLRAPFSPWSLFAFARILPFSPNPTLLSQPCLTTSSSQNPSTSPPQRFPHPPQPSTRSQDQATPSSTRPRRYRPLSLISPIYPFELIAHPSLPSPPLAVRQSAAPYLKSAQDIAAPYLEKGKELAGQVAQRVRFPSLLSSRVIPPFTPASSSIHPPRQKKEKADLERGRVLQAGETYEAAKARADAEIAKQRGVATDAKVRPPSSSLPPLPSPSPLKFSTNKS